MFISIWQTNYLLFYFSIWLIMEMINIFVVIYNVNVSRLLLGFSFFVIIILNQVITSRRDEYIINVSVNVNCYL